MIKVVAFQLLTFLSLMVTAQLADVHAPAQHWSDLDIRQQVVIIAGLSLMASIAIAACFIFRSVWVKNGYAGKDKILVDKEVALFMSHVLAFMLLEVFIFMILFHEDLNPPQYAFWICAAGFLSPEVVRAAHFIMEKFRSVKKVE